VSDDTGARDPIVGPDLVDRSLPLILTSGHRVGCTARGRLQWISGFPLFGYTVCRVAWDRISVTNVDQESFFSGLPQGDELHSPLEAHVVGGIHPGLIQPKGLNDQIVRLKKFFGMFGEIQKVRGVDYPGALALSVFGLDDISHRARCEGTVVCFKGHDLEVFETVGLVRFYKMNRYDAHVLEISEARSNNFPAPGRHVKRYGREEAIRGGPLVGNEFIESHVVVSMLVGEKNTVQSANLVCGELRSNIRPAIYKEVGIP